MIPLPIRIVLVHTTHPGNIGSVARAMKTMGLAELYLVAPKVLPEETALALATGASDILAKAIVVDTLQAAIADCGLVIGTSARSRSLEWPMLSLQEMAKEVLSQSAQSPVALLFGRERDGLSNEQLARCHYHVSIPTAPEFASLNLASAVQIVCYEIYQHFIADKPLSKDATDLAASYELELLFDHLEQVSKQVGFLDINNPRLLMQRYRRLFMRSRLEKQEVNLLRGLLTAIEQCKGEL